MNTHTAAPAIIGPGQGTLGPDAGPVLPRVEVKLGADHGLGFSVVEYRVPPRFSPPPVLHRQTREDCAVYILEGELHFWFADGDGTATAGSLIHLPRLGWNRWANEHDTPVRLLAIFQPAGFEQYFLDLGAAMVEARGDRAALLPIIGRLREQYGDEERDA